MADDLRLQLVVQAILDAKGFDDAKAALGSMADTASKAKPAIEGLGTAQNVSSREIRLATAEILRYSGVTQEAGLIGRLAAVGFRAMGDSAEYANLAMVGATLGLSVLIPLIIEWINQSDNITQAQKELKDSIEAEYTILKPFLDTLKGTNAQYEAWAQNARDVRLDKQQEEIRSTIRTIDELKGKIASVNDILEDPTLWGWIRSLFRGKDTVDDLSKSLGQATEHLKQLELAQARGIPLNEMLENGVKKATKAVKDLSDADKAHKADLERGAKLAHQQELDALVDMTTYGQKQHAAWVKELKDKEKHNIDMIDADHEMRQREAADADKNYQKMLDDQAAYAKFKIESDQAIADASVSLLGTLFGKNKAARAAGVIIDTAAAIMKTYAEMGYFATAFVAPIIAQGAAQEAAILKTGFDDPMNDILAEKLGRKSAQDFVRLFGGGFHSGLMGANAGGSVSNTTINRGVTVQSLHMSGILGVNEQDVMKNLNRKLIAAQRLEQRTTLGRA
jgi:hypothetical protein